MAVPIMDESDLTDEELAQDELLPGHIWRADTKSRVAHLLNS